AVCLLRPDGLPDWPGLQDVEVFGMACWPRGASPSSSTATTAGLAVPVPATAGVGGLHRYDANPVPAGGRPGTGLPPASAEERPGWPDLPPGVHRGCEIVRRLTARLVIHRRRQLRLLQLIASRHVDHAAIRLPAVARTLAVPTRCGSFPRGE